VAIGQNGQYVKSILDHLTMQRIEKLKPICAQMIGAPCSAGVVLRAAVDLLFEESERWEQMEQLDLMMVKRRILLAKTARPAELTADDLQALRARG
jgi:hypothetical protein